MVWRYTHEGALDPSFAGKGFFLHDGAGGGTGSSDVGFDLALDPAGSLYVAGRSNDQMTVWKLKEDGTLDTAFGGTGYRSFPPATAGRGPEVGNAVRVDRGGKILVAGASRSPAGDDDLAVWRINPDGTLDPTFGVGGAFLHGGAAGGVGTDTAHDLVIDSMGRILVIGESAGAALVGQMTLWRLR
ncbi:MAG: hypothetical protein QM765_18015 [Myxococcales bacterium]